ncbi:M61 family metallopeptidase [Altericroceibacterium endophyticum]|uniref:Peptidase M61 n=1 Tax=Altericroceibacterium endophyticum TaxID=1808508 RepID=A0A6I4T6C4_9SPHN|nr:M61 family metallopeptidase [Altericroceibacterium endophyticum]MXO65460.1 peptidase M61 [Altericroceibacterium endophyticum]
MKHSLLAGFLAASCLSSVASAENSRPQPVPITDTIPAARDIAYPGAITLDIDATDTQRGIFTVKETIDVAESGPMVLLMPEWLPGKHSEAGQLSKLASLKFTANGQTLSWKRDPVDVYAFHIDIPEGAKTVDIDLQFLSATARNQGPIVMTPQMLRLQFNSMSLYPAGYYTRNIPVSATVRYPQDWTAASGLPATAQGSTYTYETTDYQTLVDSPVLAGRFFKRFELTPRVGLDVVADTPDELEATPEQIAAHKRLVDQAVKTFGAQHYDNYEFLLSISDEISGIGLEHHRSSENGVEPGYFTEWDDQASARNLLPHEFVHSWNGKFRRPADLWTPDYRMPMRDSLMWVYEGLTQFYGYVLQARSGLVSKQDTLDEYAAIMARYDYTPGREWRPLLDTTNDPIIAHRQPKAWRSWQRSEDYYNEGLLVWMEVDSILRRESGGQKSIDDFARAFFGIRDGDWGEVTYTFDDVVNTLNNVQPYDWNSFLSTRLNETSDHAPLQGFTDNGYRLIFTDTQSDVLKDAAKARGITDLSYSLGFTLNKDGEVSRVVWDSPAFAEGMTVGDEVVAVNDAAYTPDKLTGALAAAQDTKDPIRVLIKQGDDFQTLSFSYFEGARYPHLEKIVKGKSGLDRLLEAR